jgi:hypothetical protein
MSNDRRFRFISFQRLYCFTRHECVLTIMRQTQVLKWWPRTYGGLFPSWAIDRSRRTYPHDGFSSQYTDQAVGSSLLVIKTLCVIPTSFHKRGFLFTSPRLASSKLEKFKLIINRCSGTSGFVRRFKPCIFLTPVNTSKCNIHITYSCAIDFRRLKTLNMFGRSYKPYLRICTRCNRPPTVSLLRVNHRWTQ